jgi:5-formyltetrahydrofolate cyclo-ligase
MSDSVAESKTLLRQKNRRLRKDLGEEVRARASRLICEYLENWVIFQQSVCVLTYMPIKNEVELTSLLTIHPEKKWVLPRIIPDENHCMSFHLYDADQLEVHPFGMAEPAADLPIVSYKEMQLALVPGLAFDLHGWRHGYGGGYFDRFLNDFPGVSVGITFHALLMESLTHDVFDVGVHWIITEQGIIRTSQEYNHHTYVKANLS